MKLFSHLYDKMIQWSGHRHAPYYLAGVSFAESSFFPIPPDVMLISMGLAIPKNSWYYAFITTLFSVLGGIFGYVIGYYGMEFINPWIANSSFESTYHHAEHWLKIHGILIIFIAGCAPIPYKLFTIAAGALHMALLPFIVASFFGRGLRFFLVSALMYYKGGALRTQLRRYIEIIGWAFLLLLVLIFFLIKTYSGSIPAF